MCKRRRALGRRWQREYSCSGGSYAAQASVLRALLSGAELNYCIHVAVHTPITTLDGNQVLARQVFGSNITCSKSKTVSIHVLIIAIQGRAEDIMYQTLGVRLAGR